MIMVTWLMFLLFWSGDTTPYELGTTVHELGIPFFIKQYNGMTEGFEKCSHDLTEMLIWKTQKSDTDSYREIVHMGVSENSVPLNPMVNDHYCIPIPLSISTTKRVNTCLVPSSDSWIIQAKKMDPCTSFCSKRVCTVSCSGVPFGTHKSETHFVVIYVGMRCVVPETL